MVLYRSAWFNIDPSVHVIYTIPSTCLKNVLVAWLLFHSFVTVLDRLFHIWFWAKPVSEVLLYSKRVR